MMILMVFLLSFALGVGAGAWLGLVRAHRHYGMPGVHRWVD